MAQSEGGKHPGGDAEVRGQGIPGTLSQIALRGRSVRLVNALGHRAVPLTDGMLEGRLSELPVDAEAAA
ncbi:MULTISPECIES: hypothetical protein [unclassified Streptomyces]|uniref:hypothetical protein n=1 Tax=unclassified Streptomyces TaxID=2593676 RepID=UPI003331E0F4